MSVSNQQAEVHLAPSGSIGSLGSLAAAYGDDSSESETSKSDYEKDRDAEKDDKKETQGEYLSTLSLSNYQNVNDIRRHQKP